MAERDQENNLNDQENPEDYSDDERPNGSNTRF